MSEPVFWLQIVNKKGELVKLPGGGRLEMDLIDRCIEEILAVGTHRLHQATTVAFRDGLDQVLDRAVEAITSKGVGLFRTEAHVARDIRAGLQDVLTTDLRLNHQLTHTINDSYGAGEVRQLLRAGLQRAIQSLKDQTIQVA